MSDTSTTSAILGLASTAIVGMSVWMFKTNAEVAVLKSQILGVQSDVRTLTEHLQTVMELLQTRRR
jgi:hypothetical protein